MMVHEYTTEDFIESIREEALEEGIEEGEQRRSEEIARNLLSEGSTVGFIQKITGLSTETIQKL